MTGWERSNVLAGAPVQSVDLIIADIPWLITMDPGRRVIRDAAIAVDGGKVVAVGKSADVTARYTGKSSVDGRDTVATPGFVDCHLHSSFQLSRGLADEANAQSFLFDRMYPYEAALDGDDVRVSATLAATELLRHGVTCFIDPGNYHPEASVEGVMATGIRMIVSRSSFDLTKSVLGVLDERMLIVHSGWLEPQEVEILARRKPSLVCAPSSSLHNGYGNFLFGKLPELLALGVNVAVGSDHASSGIVDMAQEIRLACCCYKETRINPRVMPPETGLEMATVNGAKPALMSERIGSIEIGKEADIVLFDTNRPAWPPLINPVSDLS